MISKENFVGRLKSNIKQHSDHIRKFAAEVQGQPGHAMDWAGGTFQNAANFEIMGEVYAALTGEGSKATVESIREYAMDRVLTMASRPERSTSIGSNAMDRERLAAWANIVKWIDERM